VIVQLCQSNDFGLLQLCGPFSSRVLALFFASQLVKAEGMSPQPHLSPNPTRPIELPSHFAKCNLTRGCDAQEDVMQAPVAF
jgi:hypothetical protein